MKGVTLNKPGKDKQSKYINQMIRISPEQKTQVKQIAEETGLGISELLRTIVDILASDNELNLRNQLKQLAAAKEVNAIERQIKELEQRRALLKTSGN